jgi:hypothetical protein
MSQISAAAKFELDMGFYSKPSHRKKNHDNILKRKEAPEGMASSAKVRGSAQ